MFGIFKRTLEKTVESFKTVITEKKEKIDKDVIEELLVGADVSYELVESMIEGLPGDVRRERLREELLKPFAGLEGDAESQTETAKPYVTLIIGVNGAGKTTTIAKLVKRSKDEGKRIMLGAGDTFRAAAIEQLKLWADKLDAPIVFTKQGHDPSAVAYDTIESAKARGFEEVIIDTAGRLHNKTNLAKELQKINRVCDKAHAGSPHRVILIIDGTQGTSAIEQAKAFTEFVDVSGIIITKLDGTSKGGAVFSIVDELKLPILFIGTGEKETDLTPFEPEAFVDSLLDSLYVEQAA